MNTNYFQTRYSFIRGRARIWKAICEDLQFYVDKKGSILDAGTGYGDFINQIQASRKIAVDIHPECKEYLRGDVEFHCTSVEDLSFLPQDSINTVFSSNLFEHLTEIQTGKALKEVYRILKKSGRFMFLQPNYRYAFREYFDDYTHRQVYSHVSLSDLLRSAGFQILRVCPRYLPLSLNSVLPKSYWLTKLYLHLPFRPLAKQMLVVASKEN